MTGDHILLTILLCRRRKKIASYNDALRSSSKGQRTCLELLAKIVQDTNMDGMVAKLPTVLEQLARNELITNLTMVYFIILINEYHFAGRIKHCHILPNMRRAFRTKDDEIGANLVKRDDTDCTTAR